MLLKEHRRVKSYYSQEESSCAKERCWEAAESWGGQAGLGCSVLKVQKERVVCHLKRGIV